jgi:hypothetical protein
MLDDYAISVRAELAAVVRAVRNGQLLRSGTHLRSLAIAGYNLRRALFCAVEGEGDGSDVEEWLKRAIDDAPRISLNVDHRVHIPWGLLYDQDPTKIPDDAECIDIGYYDAFWCIKYSVSVVHKQVTPFLPQARESFIWLSVLNGSNFDEALDALAPPETDNVQTVLVRHGNVAYARRRGSMPPANRCSIRRSSRIPNASRAVIRPHPLCRYRSASTSQNPLRAYPGKRSVRH